MINPNSNPNSELTICADEAAVLFLQLVVDDRALQQTVEAVQQLELAVDGGAVVERLWYVCVRVCVCVKPGVKGRDTNIVIIIHSFLVDLLTDLGDRRAQSALELFNFAAELIEVVVEATGTDVHDVVRHFLERRHRRGKVVVHLVREREGIWCACVCVCVPVVRK